MRPTSMRPWAWLGCHEMTAAGLVRPAAVIRRASSLPDVTTSYPSSTTIPQSPVRLRRPLLMAKRHPSPSVEQEALTKTRRRELTLRHGDDGHGLLLRVAHLHAGDPG